VILASLASGEVARRLRGAGLDLRLGPFTATIRSPIASVAEGIATLYADNETIEEPGFRDFHLSVDPSGGARRWIRRQCRFGFDGVSPFKPLPIAHALPILEWGFNWCIAGNANRYLIVHAAAIERGGRVAILPGEPGAGKSTLCAALVGSGGWRLLSDELTLIDMETGRFVPLARPISLKNESIEIIRGFVPDAVFSRETHDTSKGRVALVKATADSVRRAGETATAGWIVFPRFVPGAPPTLERESKAAAFIEIATNAFNYSIHGKRGFAVVADVVETCECYRFAYSSLDDAVQVFASLAPTR
jgi:HprK-related kinase A